MAFNIDDLPPLPPGSKIYRGDDALRHASFSHAEQNFAVFRAMVHDGAELDAQLFVDYDVPRLQFNANEDHRHFFYLSITEEYEKFIFDYLYTGRAGDFPPYPKNYEDVDYRADADYLLYLVKRDLQREDAVTCLAVEQDGFNGCVVTVKYPYGKLNFGFFPFPPQELQQRADALPEREDYAWYRTLFSEASEPEPAFGLPVREVRIKQGDRLSAVLGAIPTNTILNKTITGVGATYLEIHTKRHSIIIEPNVPVIQGKVAKHSRIIGVYEDVKEKDIKAQVKQNRGYIKIMTTPESFFKVARALKSLQIDFKEEFFLLFDECEKAVQDIDFRNNIIMPMEAFFACKNKAMVSATPLLAEDPRFEEQHFEVMKIVPDYDYRKHLHLIPTNNVLLTFRKTLQTIGEEEIKCIFCKSVDCMAEYITALKIEEKANIYCSSDSKDKLKTEYGFKNIHDRLTDGDGKISFAEYNFFTSRFFSAVDIELDYKPVVILLSEVFMAPFSIIDPHTESVQIVGRFRNGISQLIHITSYNRNIKSQSRVQKETFLNGQHEVYTKLREIELQTRNDDGGRYIMKQIFDAVEYGKFVLPNGERNRFMYGNAFVQERVKGYYRYPAALRKAYDDSSAFNITTQAVYSALTDEDRLKLKQKSASKAERNKIVTDIIYKVLRGHNVYADMFLKELQQQFGLIFEAYRVLGRDRIEQLGYGDAEIRREIQRVNMISIATSDKVVRAVYNQLKPNTTYTTQQINDVLMPVYDRYEIVCDKRGVAGAVKLYFEAEPYNTSEAKGWILGKKLLKL